ncbi:MAG: hypothetical protein WEA09_04195 [Gemmatimonadota bacterium]
MRGVIPGGARIKAVVKRLRRRLQVDPTTKAFARHNRKVWALDGQGGPRPRGVILVDFHDMQPVWVAKSYLLPLLASRHEARVLSHSIAGREPFGVPDSNASLGRVLRSMGVKEHHRVSFEAAAVLAAEEQSRTFIRKANSRSDLLALTVREVNVGLDVYESYLRRFGAATVDLDDPRLVEVLALALLLLEHWEGFFRTEEVKAVVSSHDTYVEMNTLVRLAMREGVPVYVPRPNHLHRPVEPISYGSSFPRYPALFEALPRAVQEAGVELARTELQARLAGADGGLVYMENLAFRQGGDAEGGVGRERVLAQDGKPCVVLFTHCFSDAPHVWGGMLFSDFVEWIQFVAQVAGETDFHWYLKPHPACEEASRPHLEAMGVLAPHGPLELIPGRITHHQLLDEGMTVALTAYGTIGHELPLMGVPVLNAGYNPHVGYDFNFTPESREEYRELLLRIPELREGWSVDPEDVYQFYFMHNYRVFTDDLVYPSFRGLMRDVGGHGQTCSPLAYQAFLDSWSPERHQEIIRRMEAFLDSDAVFSWEVDDPSRLLPLLEQTV